LGEKKSEIKVLKQVKHTSQDGGEEGDLERRNLEKGGRSLGEGWGFRRAVRKGVPEIMR